jgi:hypothetical protein
MMKPLVKKINGGGKPPSFTAVGFCVMILCAAVNVCRLSALE